MNFALQKVTTWLSALAFFSTCILLPGCSDVDSRNSSGQEYSTPATYPLGEASGTPGYVLSPYYPFNVIDVRDLRVGTLCKDQSTGRIFRIPGNAFEQADFSAEERRRSERSDSSNGSSVSVGAAILGIAVVGAALLAAGSSGSSSSSEDDDRRSRDDYSASVQAERNRKEQENRAARDRGESAPHPGTPTMY